MPEILTLVEKDYQPEHLILNVKETKALERIFFKEFLPYEDREIHEVCKKIMDFNRRR